MKQKLKSEIFEKRKALSKEEFKEKSAKIKKNLYSLMEFKKSKNILFYVSFNNEVDTIEIIKELLAKRAKIKNLKNLRGKEKNVLVPFVENGNPILQLSKLESINDLEQKTFGILEPKKDKIKKINISEVDLVFVPGIVFDKNGHRIGYGYGYYDRFLKKLNKSAIKIGLAFDFQLIEKISEEEHDVPLDIIVTEKIIHNI